MKKYFLNSPKQHEVIDDSLLAEMVLEKRSMISKKSKY